MSAAAGGEILRKTEWLTFAGANIKGTPAMSAEKVRADLMRLRSRCDLLVVQEFKWSWYWKQAADVLKQVMARGEVEERWGVSPGFALGFSNPVYGAQAGMWKRSRFKKVRTKVWLLHSAEYAKGLSDDRYLRAVLLKDRATGLKFWILTTHFVVGGDRNGDSLRARAVLHHDIARLSAVLATLRATGHPILGQLDANIARDSAAYSRFATMLDGKGARLHGEHGVEYLFTIDGKHARFQIHGNSVIKTKDHGGPLNTDHEARLLRFRLVEIYGKAAA